MIPDEVLEGISLMFDIIESEVGRRMDYLPEEDGDKIRLVGEWYQKMAEERKRQQK